MPYLVFSPSSPPSTACCVFAATAVRRRRPTRALIQRPRAAGGRGRASFLPFRWFFRSFHLPPSSLCQPIVVACALSRSSPSAEGGKETRACNTALSAAAAAAAAAAERNGESKAASEGTEKVAFLVLQRATDGQRTALLSPLCTTAATRNSSRRALRGGVRAPCLSLPLSHQLPSDCRDGSAKGRPGCRNGQSPSPSWVPWWQCCCWACWSGVLGWLRC